MTTVFVSSVFLGLEGIRARLRKAIAQAGDIPIGMEDFGARVESPREVFLDELRPTDVVILIVGPRYGQPDSSGGLSNTHLEFREAQQCGIPVLAFVLPEDPTLSAEETSALRAFQDEVAVSSHTYQRLDDANGLPERAMSSLKVFAEKRALLPGQFGPFQCADDFFFGLLNPSAPFSHSYELVGRRDVMDQLDDFVNGSSFVAILPGPGGVGKSRILLEFARRHENIVFLGPQFELKPEHLRQLPSQAECIVVDDAHRLQSIESLIQLVNSWSDRRAAGLKLVLTCRPAGLDRLRGAVRFLSNDDVIELQELPPLEAESCALELAVSVIGEDKPDLARTLVKATDGIPLLITVGGQLLVKDKISPVMLAQKRLFQSAALNSLLSELPSTIGGVSTGDLLALLATIGPVRPDREPFVFDMLAERLESPRSSIVSAIASLRTRYGRLVERGFRLRVSPDVLGDHLLAEAALADGRATGFIEEVLDGFGQRYLSNILSNTSELEWRLRSAESPVSVSKRIWARLHKELPLLTYRERVGLLKEIEASGWFAPLDVWRIVFWMLDNADAPDDAFNRLVSSPYSQEDIVRRVPGIIRVLSWHDKLTSICSQVLWDLGVEDNRPLNATPDHPLRVLGELLSFDPRKPLEIQERALDGLEEALRGDERSGAPRDTCVVLSPLLSRTLGWSIADGAKITMHSGALPAGSQPVVEIRTRAIGLIERQLSSRSPRLAVKAVDALLDLLRPPIGLYGRKIEPAEIASWEKETNEVVDILLNLVCSPGRPVAGYVAKRGMETTVASRFWPTIGERIERSLGEISDSEEYVLFDSLRPWAHLFSGNLDREASERLHTERIQRAAHQLLQTSDSPKELVGRVCHSLEELHAAELNPHPGRLLDCLCDLEPSSVPQLAMTILGDACGSLQQQAGLVYCRWFAQEPRAALDEIERRIEEDEEDVSLGIAGAYRQRWLGEPESHTAEHISNIAMLLTSEHWHVKYLALMALWHAKGICERQALDVLIAADFGDDARLLDQALLLINEQHGIPPQKLTPEDVEALLQKLRNVRELSGDHFHTNRFLQLAAAVSPEAVVDMFLSRIEFAASLQREKGETYQPLPYAHFVQGLQALATGPRYADLLRRIRDRVPQEHHIYRFWIPQLFGLASDGFGATAMDVLREWSTSTDPQEVIFAAFLSREAGPAFAFTQDGFVVECLRNAESLGEEVLRRVESNFHGGAASLSYHSAIGEAPKAMVQSKQRSEEMAEKHKTVPVAEAFYRRLAASFQEMIAENLAEDEELLDQ